MNPNPNKEGSPDKEGVHNVDHTPGHQFKEPRIEDCRCSGGTIFECPCGESAVGCCDCPIINFRSIKTCGCPEIELVACSGWPGCGNIASNWRSASACTCSLDEVVR